MPYADYHIKEKQKERSHKRKVSGYWKDFYKKNKERILEQQKEYYQKPEVKVRVKGYNQRPKVKKRIREYEREKYKRLEVKEKMMIRQKTKRKYLLEGKNCQFCNDKAEIHHHYTELYEYNKFDYSCHYCHHVIHSL